MNKLLEEIKKIERLLGESSRDIPIHWLRDGNVWEWNKWYDGGGINLKGVNLKGSDIGQFNLEGVDFKGANLQSVNLTAANLKNANFQDVDLRDADLKGANLQGANFKGADLRWALFVTHETPLNIAKFKNIKYDGRTKWPEDFDYPEIEQSKSSRRR